ncbi:hypothetical protein ACWCXC_31540 [Streptomyces sp. NPDC001515]
MSVPAYTPADGGFVVTTHLPTGQILVEGHVLVIEPWDRGQPQHCINHSWIGPAEEAATKVTEFVTALKAPITDTTTGTLNRDFNDPAGALLTW